MIINVYSGSKARLQIYVVIVSGVDGENGLEDCSKLVLAHTLEVIQSTYVRDIGGCLLIKLIKRVIAER